MLEATLRSDVRPKGLNTATAHLLDEALKRRVISTHEIATLIAPKTHRDRESLAETITWIHQFLQHHTVRLVSDRDEPGHRQQFPIPRKEKRPDLRIIKRVGEDAALRGQPDEELGAELNKLEDDTVEYEHDALKTYYAEMHRFPLLSFEEEQELGRRVLEERDLDARNKLISHNLRLVRWAASRRFAWSKMAFEDMVQEGNIGLLIAAERFDYRRGFKFATYALWWIRQSISRAINNQADPLRLPNHLHELREKIRVATVAVERDLGRQASPEDVARHLNIPVKVIRRALLAPVSAISLDGEMDVDKPMGRERGSSFGENLPDHMAISPETYIEACEELEAARSRLSTALLQVREEIHTSERNLEVFNLFYGLDEGGRRRTLEATSEHFDITRERVRQIIAHIWERIDEHGGNMDHRRFIQELARIEELEKIVLSGRG